MGSAAAARTPRRRPALSRLQEEVAELIVGLDEAEGFALAGGGALILRGEVQRTTRDLDFFGLTSEAVEALVPAVERALRADGLDVRRVRTGPGFARLLVERGEDVTEVDIGADARLFPSEPSRLAPTLSAQELQSTRCSPSSDEPRRGTSPTSWTSNRNMASIVSASSRRRRTAASICTSSRKCSTASGDQPSRNGRALPETTTLVTGIHQRYARLAWLIDTLLSRQPERHFEAESGMSPAEWERRWAADEIADSAENMRLAVRAASLLLYGAEQGSQRSGYAETRSSEAFDAAGDGSASKSKK